MSPISVISLGKTNVLSTIADGATYNKRRPSLTLHVMTESAVIFSDGLSSEMVKLFRFGQSSNGHPFTSTSVDGKCTVFRLGHDKNILEPIVVTPSGILASSSCDSWNALSPISVIPSGRKSRFLICIPANAKAGTFFSDFGSTTFVRGAYIKAPSAISVTLSGTTSSVISV